MESKLIKTSRLPDNTRYYIEENGRVYDSLEKTYLKQVVPHNKKSDVYLKKKPYAIVFIDGMMFKVHRLVAENFIPYPFDDIHNITVNHKDGNTLNNHYTNLSWNTQKQNVRHAFKNKLSSGDNRCGEDQYRAILTEETVHAICKMLTEHPEYSYIRIGKTFGLHWHYIDDIARYKSWVRIAVLYDFIPRISIESHLEEFVQIIRYIRKGYICNEIIEKMGMQVKNGNTRFRGMYNYAKFKLIPMLEKIGYYSITFPTTNMMKTAILKYSYPNKYGSIDNYVLR